MRSYTDSVTGTVLRFERVYDLPREIVWDALVDSDLVSGWLAEAHVDPRIGGCFDLDWRQFHPAVQTHGEIIDLVEPALLVIDTSNFGRTTVELADVAGGSRDRSTHLTVVVEALADQHFAGSFRATWVLSLEQLEQLLLGHPVDWSTWAADYAHEWRVLAAEGTRRN